MLESRQFKCACGETQFVMGRINTAGRCLACGETDKWTMVYDSGPAVRIDIEIVRSCNSCHKPLAKLHHRFCACGGTIVDSTGERICVYRGS